MDRQLNLPHPAGGRKSRPASPLDAGALADQVEAAIWDRRGRREGKEIKFLCPEHNDHHPSASWNPQKRVWTCRVCQAGGGLVDLAERLGLSANRGRAEIVATYDYCDEDGRLLFQVVRYTPKAFRQRRPDGQGGWIWQIGDVRRVLYRLPEVVRAAPRGGAVYVVEGEKDADALARLGLVATTNPGGAGKWQDAYTETLRGASVVILPDADEPGRRHAEQVAAALHGVAASVKVLALPGLPEKGDVSDWLNAGGTREELERLADDAPEWGPPQPQPQETLASPGFTLIRLAEVQAQPVRWLWPGRVPLGKLTVLDGDPGLGKSLLTLDLAAGVSQGRAMPWDAASTLDGPRGVVVLSAEDDAADTIRPRLEAAGADLNRVAILSVIKDRDGGSRGPHIGDLDSLRAAVKEMDAALVVIDPLAAHLPEERDAHRDQDVRRALAPLAGLAGETGAAIVVVRHLTKTAGGSHPLYRGTGSIGIIGAARSGLLVVPDPDDRAGQSRILAVTKSNLAAPAASLRYQIVERDGAAAIAWLGPSPYHAADLLHAAAEDPDAQTERQEAAAWLADRLADGPVPAKQIRADAEQAGYAWMTVRRAKQLLGVQVAKAGFQGEWTWQLPAKGAHAHEVSTFGQTGSDMASNPAKNAKEVHLSQRCSPIHTIGGEHLWEGGPDREEIDLDD